MLLSSLPETPVSVGRCCSASKPRCVPSLTPCEGAQGGRRALSSPAGASALQLFCSSSAEDAVSSSPDLLLLAVFIAKLRGLQKTSWACLERACPWGTL